MKNRRWSCWICVLVVALQVQSIATPISSLIYLTPLQCEDMGDIINEPKWPVVQENLHGLWFNNAGNSDDETRRIIMRLDQYAYPIILPFSFKEVEVEGESVFTYNTPAWSRYQSINSSLSGNKILLPTDMVFDCTDVAEGTINLHLAIAAINAAETNADFANLASGVIFSPRHGLEEPSAGIGTYFWRTRKLIDEVNGMAAIEMAPWRMNGLPRAREGFINIYNYAKSKGLAFTWLMNRGVGTNNDQWIADIERALIHLQNNEVYPDVIAISNQGDNTVGLLSRVPEKDTAGIPQDTITGGLYRLLVEFGWTN